MNPGILRNLQGFFVFCFAGRRHWSTRVMEGQRRDNGGTAPQDSPKTGCEIALSAQVVLGLGQAPAVRSWGMPQLEKGKGKTVGQWLGNRTPEESPIAVPSCCLRSTPWRVASPCSPLGWHGEQSTSRMRTSLSRLQRSLLYTHCAQHHHSPYRPPLRSLLRLVRP